MLVEALGSFGPLALAWFEIVFSRPLGLFHLTDEIVAKYFLADPGGRYITAVKPMPQTIPRSLPGNGPLMDLIVGNDALEATKARGVRPKTAANAARVSSDAAPSDSTRWMVLRLTAATAARCSCVQPRSSRSFLIRTESIFGMSSIGSSPVS
jgi:hypothetical protein